MVNEFQNSLTSLFRNLYEFEKENPFSEIQLPSRGDLGIRNSQLKFTSMRDTLRQSHNSWATGLESPALD